MWPSFFQNLMSSMTMYSYCRVSSTMKSQYLMDKEPMEQDYYKTLLFLVPQLKALLRLGLGNHSIP